VEVATRLVGLAIGVAALGGCHTRTNARSSAPCAGGHCDVHGCELGICDESDDPFASMSSTISNHSQSAGAFSESENATCPFVDEELPPLETYVDDSTIPEFDGRRSRRTNMKAGQAFLQDHELHQHLLGVQGALFECLDIAQCYDDDVVSNNGALDFEFWLEPDGTVSAVSVEPTETLDQPVIRACARRSVYNARFPAYNGGGMKVSYSVEFSEA
jgi:hypothetical protein